MTIRSSSSRGRPTKCSFRHSISLLDLSDDLLAGILFSGYLGKSLEEHTALLCVNRHLEALGHKTIGVIIDTSIPQAIRKVSDGSDDSGEGVEDGEYKLKEEWTHWLTAKFCKMQGLVHVNLAYSSATLSPSLLGLLSRTKRSLTYLDLRGNALVGDDCLPHIAQLDQLRYLNLSKNLSLAHSTVTSPITDEGAIYLASLGHLTFLDLSMTSITDATINVLCQGDCSRSLTHLVLQCCSELTNDCLAVLRMLSLEVLDLCGNVRLPIDFFHDLAVHHPHDDAPPLHHSLRALDISYMTNVTEGKLRCIAQQLPRLSHLFCRARHDFFNRPFLPLKAELAEKVILFLCHADILALPRDVINIADVIPHRITRSCLLSNWPYHQQQQVVSLIIPK
eukprot:gene1244-1357_t